MQGHIQLHGLYAVLDEIEENGTVLFKCVFYFGALFFFSGCSGQKQLVLLELCIFVMYSQYVVNSLQIEVQGNGFSIIQWQGKLHTSTTYEAL